MAAAYAGTHVERVSAELTGDVTFPYRVTTVWEAIDTATGLPIQTTTAVDVALTTPLTQGQWDNMFAQVNTDFAALTGGTGPTVNPVVV